MKFSNINKYVAGAALTAILATACTGDFEEVNENPNGPVVIPSHLHLPAMIEQTADIVYDMFNSGDMGETWIQHWAKVQYNEEERYNPRVTSINNWWDQLYARPLMDSKKMYLAAIDEQNNVTKGVALIWQTYVFSLLTDTFGDVPYSGALQAEEGKTLPMYDKQEDIYPAMVDSLEAAVGYLAGPGTLPAAQDILYGGDVAKWEKFANSLRVRLLMRMSGKVDVGAELQAIVNGGAIFSSNADNSQLNYRETNPNANPVWNNVVFTNRLEWRINETLVTLMDGLSDPRLPVYAQPNDGGEIRGAAPGINNPTVNGYDYANTSMLGEYFLRPNTPGVFMDYAELNFLLAEAAKRSLIGGGDATAASYYNAGVTASFDTFKGFKNEDGSVVNLVPADYLAIPAVAYDAANGLNKIYTQKYIALYFQGIEAFSEWRRTKVPALSPAIDPIGINQIPSRYIYPSNEQTLNATNYQTAVDNMKGDLLTSKVWWME
ncbi:SusD/RagB family nutrient-binding outer membrane lipoprotein [Dawidia soli]|uniref:SusD/RagB family nutrient-binding outer membrane lipoprotein n=1 Tax=Dawidia soli TaxID=2782352 RepID=A0AAP2DHS4_9BACT|nr:SusD/RagB family nutrient-binding outer membrane lipoprotein [Dawidia soli]MBT1689622.1 SusD/RagB family nutrient-binding outer membrane lipoprotein [Dawidia soli]